MNFDQLRIFVTVAERRHVTQAAQALGMSQSAVSAAIKALEKSSAVRLFDRVGRNIELSRAGAAFLPEAKAVLDRALAARLLLENLSRQVVGSLSIWASQTIAGYWLPARLAAFHKRFPAVKLDVSVGNTRQVETAVLEGTADVGLVEGRTRSGALKRMRVDIDRLVLVASPTLTVPLWPEGIHLAGMTWIVRERGSGTREVLEDLVAEQGSVFSELDIALILPSNEAVRQAVEAGAGATVISERVVTRSLHEGALRRIEVDVPAREFAMVTHAERDPSISVLALKEHLRGPGRMRGGETGADQEPRT